MSTYTATAYTTLGQVRRILRAENRRKISIGEQSTDNMTVADATEYIKDASRFIDAMLRKILTIGKIPLTGTYAEIEFTAPRIAAFMIYKSIYHTYRLEETPAGPRGWFDESKDMIKTFIDNIENGMYSELSASTVGPAWDSVERMFQVQIGVESVDDSMRSNQFGTTAPIQTTNLGPQNGNS